MRLMFIGEDKSMGLHKYQIYDCHIYSDDLGRIWVNWKTSGYTRGCPYSSIWKMLENWVVVKE